MFQNCKTLDPNPDVMENDYSPRPVAGTDVNNSTTNFREKLHDYPKC